MNRQEIEDDLVYHAQNLAEHRNRQNQIAAVDLTKPFGHIRKTFLTMHHTIVKGSDAYYNEVSAAVADHETKQRIVPLQKTARGKVARRALSLHPKG